MSARSETQTNATETRPASEERAAHPSYLCLYFCLVTAHRRAQRHMNYLQQQRAQKTEASSLPDLLALSSVRTRTSFPHAKLPLTRTHFVCYHPIVVLLFLSFYLNPGLPTCNAVPATVKCFPTHAVLRVRKRINLIRVVIEFSNSRFQRMIEIEVVSYEIK